MTFLSKTISSEKNSWGQLLVKVLRMGTADVQLPKQANNFGIDSNPVKDMVAIYQRSSANGNAVIVGYLQKNSLADIGETRLFSTDQEGEVQMYVWAKNDGTLLLGGDSKNLVRYQELETAFNSLKSTVDDLISKFNAHTHILTLSSGTGSAAIPANPGTPSTADITGAKINEIKTL